MGPEGASVMTAAQSAFLDGWSSSMWLAAGIAAAAALAAAVLIPSAQTRTTGNTGNTGNTGMVLGAAEAM
jgi:hypothetical protein